MHTEMTVDTALQQVFATPKPGVELAGNVLKGAVAELLTLAHGADAVGVAEPDPDLIMACWVLGLRIRPEDGDSLEARARSQALLDVVRTIVGTPAGIYSEFAYFFLDETRKMRLIALAKGTPHA